MIVDDLKKALYLASFQGKLTESFDFDSNIQESLDNIIVKKQIDKKEIRRRKITDDYDEQYSIPSTWKWVKLGFLCDVIRGLTFSTSYNVQNENTILVLRGGNIDSKTEELLYDDNIFVDESIPNENQYLRVGDTLIVASSGTKTSVGKSSYIHTINDKVSFGGFMMVVRPYQEILNPKYLSYHIKMYRNKIISDTNGYISNITNTILNNLMIPLPPIEEQERIVQKIEEIFSHLDDIKSLEEKISAIKKNFPREMKKSILFSAISGKLSVQNNNDTPVDNQLEKIKRESEQFYLINEIKNSHRKNHDYKFFTDDTYVIPATWKYVPLSSTCLSIFSGKSPKYVKYNNDNLILGQKVNQEDGLHFEDLKYGTDEFIKSLPKYQFLIKNDVLLNTLGGGSVGRCGIFDNDIPNITTDGHIFVIRTAGVTNEKYIMYLLRLYREKLEEYANGTTNQKFFNIKQIEDVMIPLPPIEEQKRIVEKIEQLLPLCNDIEKLIKS